MIYLESFSLPIDKEEELLERKAAENGGPLGYIDNPYPCRLFAEKDLYELYFRPVTILYGGNGSGKSTLLNLIAGRLGLQRVSPCTPQCRQRNKQISLDRIPGHGGGRCVPQ